MVEPDGITAEDGGFTKFVIRNSASAFPLHSENMSYVSSFRCNSKTRVCLFLKKRAGINFRPRNQITVAPPTSLMEAIRFSMSAPATSFTNSALSLHCSLRCHLPNQSDVVSKFEIGTITALNRAFNGWAPYLWSITQRNCRAEGEFRRMKYLHCLHGDAVHLFIPHQNFFKMMRL